MSEQAFFLSYFPGHRGFKVLSMKVISIVNRKGGVGKTTTAVYLALCLSKLAKRVLVVDLDPQGNATQLLIRKTFIPDDKTIGDVLTGDVSSLKEVVVASDVGDLDVAPASDRIKEVERRIDRYPLRDFLLSHALESVDYDFVVIDTSPAADSNLVRNGIFASTHAMIPIEASLLSMSGYVLALEDLDTLFRHLPKGRQPKLLGPLLTRWDKRESVAIECFEYLTEHEDDRFPQSKLFQSVIRTNTRLKNVVDPTELKPRKRSYDDYMALALEVIGRVFGNTSKEKPLENKKAPQKSVKKAAKTMRAKAKTSRKKTVKKSSTKNASATRKAPRRRVQRKRSTTASKTGSSS
jgi:chromosome partitioning protein